MWTYCSPIYYPWTTNVKYYLWSTITSNIKNALQYAKNKWYVLSSSEYFSWDTTTLFQKIKEEINSWRPNIVSTSNHSFIAYWYSNANYNSKVIRVNLWWWVVNFYDTSKNVYFSSNIDYNMDSLYYNWQTQWAILNLTTFKLQ